MVADDDVQQADEGLGVGVEVLAQLRRRGLDLGRVGDLASLEQLDELLLVHGGGLRVG